MFGQITNEEGQPIKGTRVQFDNEIEVFPTYGDGFYYRLSTPGKHTISASADGN